MYGLVDAVFMGPERANIQQNRFLRWIPNLRGRKGGTHTVTEWGYTIGLFQAVVHQTMKPRDKLEVLDVGCGTGRLAVAVAPLLGREGRYVGVDVNPRDIAFAKAQYPDSRISFAHLEHSNRSYAPKQATKFSPYPFPANTFDVVTALSVWTHLNEADGIFYAKEVARVLKPGGKAIITFFYLDADYEAFKGSVPDHSAFSLRPPKNYVFTQDIDGSEDWLRPSWTPDPESVVGVTPKGLERLQEQAGLRLDTVHRGNWKEAVGLFFQDVLVFSKPA